MVEKPRKKEELFCAPGITPEGGTCFDRAGLLRIIRKYNKRYPEHRIIFKRGTPNHLLWSLIRDRNGFQFVAIRSGVG